MSEGQGTYRGSQVYKTAGQVFDGLQRMGPSELIRYVTLSTHVETILSRENAGLETFRLVLLVLTLEPTLVYTIRVPPPKKSTAVKIP